MPYSTLSIASLLVCYALIAVFLVYESHSFNLTGAKKFSFFRTFPFELNLFKKNQKYSFWNLAFQMIISLMIILPYLFFGLSCNESNMIPAILILVAAVILVVIFNCLTFVKLSNYKLHLGFAVAFSILTLCLDVLYMIFFGFDFMGISNFGFRIDFAPSLVIFILTIIFFLGEAALMFNPNYKDRDRMVKVDAETYSRPKFCYLTILEWGTLLVFLLQSILIVIAIFCKK